MTLEAMQWVLLGYAVLLGVGGVIGYVKAGSRVSLIAGLVSAALTLVCLVVMGHSRWVGAALAGPLAVALAVVFGLRMRKTRKFMPAGLLSLVSQVVAVAMFVTAWTARPR
jgi:uncharacterized membrane protein (UPF0136 family)